jgi:hypothetical protein
MIDDCWVMIEKTNHKSTIPGPGLPRNSYGKPDMEEQQKQGIIRSRSRQGGRK